MQIEEEAPAGLPHWMLTFGDMMALLLTFFILLVSMSEIRQDDKFQGIADSINGRFGVDSTGAAIPGESRPRDESLAALVLTGRNRRMKLSVVTDAKSTGAAGVADGPVIVAEFAFEAGQFELDDSQRERLRAIAEKLRAAAQVIEVRGQSFPAAITTVATAADPLDLAYQRARVVSQFLEGELQFDPQRIRIAVANTGRLPNRTLQPALREASGRVEVLLLEERFDGSSTASAE